MARVKKFVFDEQEQGLEDIMAKSKEETPSAKPEADKKREEKKKPIPSEPKMETEKKDKEETAAEIALPEREMHNPDLRVTKKETKSVRKMILIKPSLAGAIKKASELYHISENEVINQLLERSFYPEEYKSEM